MGSARRLPRVGGAGAHVDPLALTAEDGQELDRALVGATEPVRHTGVELRGLARLEHDVVLSQHHAQAAVEDVEPFVALVGLGAVSYTHLRAHEPDSYLV